MTTTMLRMRKLTLSVRIGFLAILQILMLVLNKPAGTLRLARLAWWLTMPAFAAQAKKFQASHRILRLEASIMLVVASCQQ